MNIKLMKSTHFIGQSNCDTSYPSISEKFSHQDGRDHVLHEASLWAGCWHRGSQVHVLASCHPVQQPHSWSWVRSGSILRNHNMSSRSAAGSGGQTRCHPRQTWKVEGRSWGLQENIRPTCSMWLQQHFITSKIITIIIIAEASLLQMLLLTTKLDSDARLFPSFHFLPSTRLTLQNSDLRSLGPQYK